MDVNKLSDMWEGRLTHVIQYLGFRSWLDFASASKRTLKATQYFFKDKRETFEKENSIEPTMCGAVAGASFPDGRWARCLLKINAVSLTRWGGWNTVLVKPINFKENGNIVYGWVLGAPRDGEGKRDRTTIAGHFRPYPGKFSLSEQRRENPATVAQLIPWK